MKAQGQEEEALRRLSAHVGGDLLLVQGAGGNSSLKDEHSLLIKASGTCLGDALEQEIFVRLDLPQLRALIALGAEDLQPAVRTAPSGLKPSIETFLHALLPHRFVLHTHALHTIVCGVRTDAESVLDNRLRGLPWCHVPYVRPGLPLQRKAKACLARKGASGQTAGDIDILVLGNHGLVVGADSAQKVLQLTREVERRLALAARCPQRFAGSAALSRQRASTGFRLPRSDVSHALAFDEQALAVARRGSLYPDHVVFLGSAIAVEGEREESGRGAVPPQALAVPEQGLLLRAEALPAADDLLHLLSEVTTRLSCSDSIRYLNAEEEDALVDWDAEKLRLNTLQSRTPPKKALKNAQEVSHA